MPREFEITSHMVAKAVRSLERNRRLQRAVENRIERAESQIRSYLLIQGESHFRISYYQVELADEVVRITLLPISDQRWQQLHLRTADPVAPAQ